VTTSSPSTGQSLPFSKLRRVARRWSLWLALASVVLAATGFYLIEAHWPYRYRNVNPLLQNIFASQIKIDHYHRTYFPHPGFVATGLTLRRTPRQIFPLSAPRAAWSFRAVGSIFSFFASVCAWWTSRAFTSSYLQ
jgi:hypothetical protein